LYVGISASALHTCALRNDGRIDCWGDNQFGELGNAQVSETCPYLDTGRSYPCSTDPVSTNSIQAKQVVAGFGHTCALDATGRAFCWGDNNNGQLGTGNFASVNSPTPVAGGLIFTQLAAGDGVTCGVTVNQAAYCWGANYAGQLGDGTSEP